MKRRFQLCRHFRWIAPVATLVTLSCAAPAWSASTSKGIVERIQVRGQSLEGNLAGDSPVRDVAVYLPSGYADDSQKRYPVVYLLHGFTDSVEKWWSDPDHFITLPDVLDRAFRHADTRDVIVVMPDANTRFFGSFYSRSVTTGDWEQFVAEELTSYIDAHYRTLPDGASRGLAGHSMGGYGALRIGMKYPDVFRSVYLLNACCLLPRDRALGDRKPPWEAIETDEDLASAGFMTKAAFATAAAWAPNPKNPPFYLDLPTVDGELRSEVHAKIVANSLLSILDQYVGNLRRLHALAFDVGEHERLAADARALDRALTRYDLPHEFEIYDGNHTNRVAERIETKVLPFFTRHLKFE